MNTLGEWYTQQNPSYGKWHQKQKRDILFYQLKIYAIPALFMMGLGLSHFFIEAKETSTILCFSLITHMFS